MAEAEVVTEVSEASTNGTCLPEDTVEAVSEKKVDIDGVKELEEEDKQDEKDGVLQMDVDHKLKEENDSKEEEECKEMVEEKEEAGDVKMGEENDSKEEDESKEMVEKAEEVNEEKDKAEERIEEKDVKKRGKARTRSVRVQKEVKKKDMDEKKVKEPTTPAPSSVDRPVRERKSVERLVASLEKEAVKEFHIEKGRGTPLKDIPNVAFKLSRRKTDDTFKLLHTILFGRRGKAFQVKSNISQFSGFVWHENEEKQKIKVKEKFDKCVKEKLFEFCDVLDIPVSKATARKEDIVMKLIDFLVAPHATSTALLAEKEQSNKSRKRKRVVKRSDSKSGETPTKPRSAKNRRMSDNTSKGKEKSAPESEDESEEEEVKEVENENGIPDQSEGEVPEDSDNEEKEDESEEESEDDTGKHKQGSKKSSTKKASAGKTKTKPITIPKKSSSAASPKKVPNKSSSKHSKVDNTTNTSPRVFSRKKKNEEPTKKSSTPMKSATKEKVSKQKTGKKVAKVKNKTKEEEPSPSDAKLRNAICEILKKVDFNTATFTDILKQLARQFDMDLTPRKSSIKLMIQEELTKLADEAEEDDENDDEGEGDAEKDDPQPSGQEVEA